MSPTSSHTDGGSFRRAHPRTFLILLTLIGVFTVADVALGLRLLRYRSETERLRGGMSDSERQRADMEMASEENKLSVMVELIRRQALGDPLLHLSVSVDSGTMRLERDGALLREMRVEVGEERVVGVPPDTMHLVRPRGARTVERIIGAKDIWDVPAWVFTERGVPVPEKREMSGALGRSALMLSGGTFIYALPDSGLLADRAFVLPGSLRISREDLRAIAPNVIPGVTVYFYE
ncbi:MAG: hypothetical protein ABIZ91_08595 [Gemmatimonadaceae bacterium]